MTSPLLPLRYALRGALVGLTLIAASCGGGDSFEVTEFANIAVDPGAVELIVGSIPVGQSTERDVRITNSGQIDLEIRSIRLEYDPVSPEEAEGGPALQLAGVPAEGTLVAPLGSPSAEASDRVNFRVVFKRYDNAARSGRLIIESNDREDPALEVEVTVREGQPVMIVLPDVVEFRSVRAGETPRVDVTLSNTGNSPLRVNRLVLLGDEVFSLALADQIFEVNELINFDPPLEIGPQQSSSLQVQFAPRDELPAQARLVIFANTENALDGFEVPVLGNDSGPCIEVSPKKVNFGAKLKGGTVSEIPVSITSCGEDALEISEARLSTADDADIPDLAAAEVTESSDHFELDFTGVTADDAPPADDAPWTIAVNATEDLLVRYTTPDRESPKDENGLPLPDRGFIVLKTNAFREYVSIEVTGFSVPVICPTAIIDIEEGNDVIPQTTLHLDGTNSLATNGAITDYQWSVQQPPGSVGTFIPTDTFPQPVFEVNAAGEYIFQLVVRDASGQESCEPATEVVTVIPDEALHVELLWTTPGDPDEFDEGPRKGTDLDLHFVHPFAGGQDLDLDGVPDGYFDDPFDCFWYNPHPDWENVDPNVDDNPGLDRDDTDGGGPENMNLNVPADGVVYKVGVHYWQDPTSAEFPSGFGPTEATVRVFVFGEERWKREGVSLVEKDMWEAATIAWPEQTIEPIAGSGPDGVKIIPNYVNPFFLD